MMKTSTIPTTLPSIPERGRALRLGAAAVALSAGCSPQQHSDDVDIANAARAAQEAMGNYVGETPMRPPTTQTSSAPAPAPAPAASPTPTPSSSEPTSIDGSAEGAVDVVRTYFRLIGERRYRAAWELWDNDGAASGMSAEAFARSFDKYRDLRASVGEPGRIDAGAGQRYITVPVSLSGTLRDGRPVTMKGPVTLHRAGDVDGATERQRRWRIHQSGLRPQPQNVTGTNDGDPPGDPDAPSTITARYRCDDKSAFTATFDNRRDTALLTLRRRSVTLKGQRPASGIWYAGDGYELRGKGSSARLTRPGGTVITCSAQPQGG